MHDDHVGVGFGEGTGLSQSEAFWCLVCCRVPRWKQYVAVLFAVSPPTRGACCDHRVSGAAVQSDMLPCCGLPVHLCHGDKTQPITLSSLPFVGGGCLLSNTVATGHHM